jgi:membrane protease YdiL (CAAX protease family)
MNLNENNLLPPDPAPSFDSSEQIDSGPPSSPAQPAPLSPNITHPITISFGAENPLPTNNSVTEDIRVPWGWTDLVLFLVLAIAGFILISLFVGLALAMSGANFRHIQNNPHDINLLSIFIQVLVDLALLAYLAAQMRLRFRSPFWHTIGWSKPDTGRIPPLAFYSGLILSGFFLSIIVSLGSSFFPPAKNLPIETLFQDRYATVLFMSVAVLLAPLVEETIFRGYIYPVVARSFGKLWGILATGTLFGLLHASQLWGGWSQIALLVFVGVVLTFARAVSRTVVASFVIHTSYNSVQVIGLLVATHGLRHLPGAF